MRTRLAFLLAVSLALAGCDSDGRDPGTGSPPPRPAPGNAVTVSESEPNNDLSSFQELDGPGPFLVLGRAESSDGNALLIDLGDGLTDDLEDFYALRTTGSGPTVTLSGFSENLDLYVFGPATPQGNVDLAGSATTQDAAERVDASDQPAGTYLIAVSFFDARGEEGQTTYRLLIE